MPMAHHEQPSGPWLVVGGRVPVGSEARNHMHTRFYGLTTVRAVLLLRWPVNLDGTGMIPHL